MILAHVYGVPEAATIVIPIVLFLLILRAGRRRQEAEGEEPAEDGPDVTADPTPDAPPEALR